MGGEREILDEQIAYHRARAGEYDQTSAPACEAFDPLFDPIRDRIRDLVPGGRVLELAAGTGQWTGVESLGWKASVHAAEPFFYWDLASR